MFTKTPWLKAQMLISFAAVLVIGFAAAVTVSLTTQHESKIGSITLGGSGKAADLAMPYWNVEYVLGDNLTDVRGTSKAYIVEHSRSVENVANFIKVIFNVSGETWEAQQGDARSVFVGKKLNNYIDYSKPSIMVSSPSANAPVNWTYAAANNAAVSVEVGVDGQPVDVKNPDEAEMLQTVNSYLYGLQAPIDKLKISSNVSYGYGYVNAYLIVDGVESNLGWMFSFDSNNNLVSASGVDFNLVAAEKFTTVSQLEAFKRVGGYRWNADFYNYPMVVAYPTFDGISSGSGSASANSGTVVGGTPVEPVKPSASETSLDATPEDNPIVISPAPDVTSEPYPTAYPTPEKQIVVINHVEKSLALVYDDSGKAYLLPSYKMSDGTIEHVYHVFAFVEGAVKLPENIIMPMMARN